METLSEVDRDKFLRLIIEQGEMKTSQSQINEIP